MKLIYNNIEFYGQIIREVEKRGYHIIEFQTNDSTIYHFVRESVLIEL